MDWKKPLFVVMLAGMMVFAVVGCSEVEKTVPTMEQPSPSTEQPAPTPEGTRPAPPEGVASGEKPPAPPEGVAPGERSAVPEMDLAAAA